MKVKLLLSSEAYYAKYVLSIYKQLCLEAKG